MPTIRLTFFGTPRVEICGGERRQHEVTFRRRKAVALLAVLAVDARAVERDELAAVFWPDLDHERARAALRQTLWEINGATTPSLLKTEGRRVSFDAEQPGVWVDVTEFLQLTISPVSSNGADDLRRATELYGNGFLVGFGVRGSAEFDRWQTQRAEELRADFLGALTRLTETYAARGEGQLAVATARRLIAVNPYDETAHRRLMTLYAEAGDRAAALKQFAVCARTLADELGERPQPLTVRLSEAIKRGEKLTPESPAPGVRVAREQIAVAVPRPTSALPRPATVFVGREDELKWIAERLADDDCRLLTLAGAGGVGKTRLALRAAELAGESFADGARFVALAGLASRKSLLTAIARVVGAGTFAERGDDVPDELIAHLRDQSVLLVLDNFEHLLDCADVLAEMLGGAPRVKLLVTSRERLQLRGEWVFDVRGLDYPPERANAPLENYQAAQLFAQTARRADDHFELTNSVAPDIARICRAVEGMPLAIELAASWVRALSCRQIADEIAARSLDLLTSSWRDLPARHRNMRAVFDVSYLALDERESAIARKLSVFPQDFDEEAASNVAGATRSTLAALVDKSLLRREGDDNRARFSFHELIHQFVAEKAAEHECETSDARDRHCRFYAALAASAREGETAAEEHDRRLALETANVRAGWRRAITTKRPPDIAAYSNAMFRFYDLKGFFEEGYETFGSAAGVVADAALPRSDNFRADQVRARLLNRQGVFAAHLGMNDRAAQLFEESLPFFSGEEATLERAGCLNRLGMVLYHLGRREDARAHLRESLDIYRAGGDYHGTMMALNRLAYLAGEDKHHREAKRLLKESLSLSRAHGTAQEIVNSLNDLGYALYLAGENDEARRLLEESRALCEEIGYRKGSAATLDNLGCVAQAVGDSAEAERCFHLALAVAEELRARPIALDIIKGIAALGADDAERRSHSVELLRFVVDHPAAWEVTKGEARLLLSRLDADRNGSASRANDSSSVERVAARLLTLYRSMKDEG